MRENEMKGSCVCMGDRRSAYRVMVGRPEGKRQLERPRHRWKDKIKMDIQEAESAGVGWVDVPQDRDGLRALVNAVINLRVP
jgi:hypothetical protein